MDDSVGYRMATVADTHDLAEMRWDFRTEGTTLNADDPEKKQAFLDSCAEFLREGLVQGTWHYWVAEKDGEIMAMMFVQVVRKVPKPAILDESFGYLTNVYTRPAHRGQGIGSSLLERVQEWAREKDLEFLITWPSEESKEFYGRAGFTKSASAFEYEVRPYIE